MIRILLRKSGIKRTGFVFAPKRKLPVAVHIALGVVLGFAVTTIAHAKDPLFEVPVYNPHTKSYFELVPFREENGKIDMIKGKAWRDAEALARQRVFKEARGRLAIVRDEQTRQFLRDTFHTDRASWIGARFWCTQRRMEWVDGRNQKPGDYANWDPNWDQTNFMKTGTCPGWSSDVIMG